MLTVKSRRIILLFALLLAAAGISFLTNTETSAQAPTLSVQEAPSLTVVSASTTAVELSWNAVAGAVSYDLRAWWAGAATWQRIDDGSQTDVFFTHRSLSAGRTYFYIVAGVGADGRRGPWSAQVEVTVPGSDAPTSTPTFTPTLSPASTYTPTPTVSVTVTPTSAAEALSAPTLRAEGGAGQITLSWGAVSDADSYQLIVWDWSISDWRSIGGVLQGTSFVHRDVTEGTTYYYHVRAEAGGGGVVSAWSGQVSTVASASVLGTPTSTATAFPTLQLTPTPTATAAPLSAPALSAEASDGAIKLTWSAAVNADSYQLIFWDWRLQDWRGIGGVLRGTSYTHGGLTAGTTHHYHVRAAASNGAFSAWSALASADIAATSAATATPTMTATPTAYSTPTGTATPTVSSTPTVTATPATTERGALVALFEATDGSNWTYSFNWLSDAPLSSWHDVETDEHGRVSDLALTENNLRGVIPDLSALS